MWNWIKELEVYFLKYDLIKRGFHFVLKSWATWGSNCIFSFFSMEILKTLKKYQLNWLDEDYTSWLDEDYT